MAIYYADEHVNCSCYSGMSSPTIELIWLQAKEKRSLQFTQNVICLLLDGHITLYTDGKIDKVFETGHFVFAPANASCSLQADETSRLLLVRIPDIIRLCQSFDIQQLFSDVKTNEEQLELFKFSTLEMNERLWDYVNTLTVLLEDGLKCVNFLQMKVDELLLLLRAYYTKEELRNFFFYILNPNSVFIDFVRRNWMNYKTIAELAEEMNMSPQHFSKRFKEIFDQSPGTWVLEQKAQLILAEIRGGAKSFQQISDDFGFSAQSHFNRFCKKMLGSNPNALRKGKSVLLKEPNGPPESDYIQVPIRIKAHDIRKG